MTGRDLGAVIKRLKRISGLSTDLARELEHHGALELALLSDWVTQIRRESDRVHATLSAKSRPKNPKARKRLRAAS
jgi:hypothetical protein